MTQKIEKEVENNKVFKKNLVHRQKKKEGIKII